MIIRERCPACVIEIRACTVGTHTPLCRPPPLLPPPKWEQPADWLSAPSGWRSGSDWTRLQWHLGKKTHRARLWTCSDFWTETFHFWFACVHLQLTCKCVWDVVLYFYIHKQGRQIQGLVLLIPQTDVVIACRMCQIEGSSVRKEQFRGSNCIRRSAAKHPKCKHLPKCFLQCFFFNFNSFQS